MKVAELDAGAMRELVKRGSKPSTRRNMHIVLRSRCGYAVEAGLLAEAPRFPPLPRTGATVQVVLSSHDLRAILAVTPAPYRLAFELAAFAGLRAGEVRGLRVRDVDLVRRVLVVRRLRDRALRKRSARAGRSGPRRAPSPRHHAALGTRDQARPRGRDASLRW